MTSSYVSAFWFLRLRSNFEENGLNYIGMIHFKDNKFEITAATRVEKENELVLPVGVSLAVVILFIFDYFLHVNFEGCCRVLEFPCCEHLRVDFA